MDPSTSFAIALGTYVLLVLGVGVLATRRASSSSEEYFLAGRGLGTLVLFMALFGTNCTAFVLVGIPGQAYHDGLGVFSVNAPIVALGIPLTFWAIGAPARRLAREHGALTPAELYSRRFGSRAVGIVLFTFFTLYTLFVRFLPQVAIAEVKTVMPEADPHFEGWGHHDDRAEQGAH